MLSLVPRFQAGRARIPSKARTVRRSGFHSTSFPATENPLSEGGIWRNGATHGLDWKDMKSTGGNAVGSGINSGFNDNIACLTGWPPGAQYIRGVLFVDAGYAPPGGHEAELHLHCTIGANSITTYEFLCDPVNQTFQAVRWDGAIGDLFFGISPTAQNGGLTPGVNGDEFLFVSDGAGNFGVYQNGTIKWTFTDTTRTGGAPGIATYWLNAGNNGDRLGWQSIEAGTVP